MLARTGPQARWRGDKEWDAQSIVSDLEKGYHVEGPSKKIRGVSSVLQACEGDLAFCAWEGDKGVIQTGVAIGSEGFAYERHPDGIKLERFPHLAGVVIGDSVEISSNCSIARGSLTDTFIGSGTKLDALVHVAHNVRLGTNCQLAAGTIIGGSTVVGDSCWTGLNSTLKNTIKVGNNVLVGAGACVINDVPDGDIVAGVPAKSIKQKVTSNELFIMTGKNAA